MTQVMCGGVAAHGALRAAFEDFIVNETMEAVARLHDTKSRAKEGLIIIKSRVGNS